MKKEKQQEAVDLTPSRRSSLAVLSNACEMISQVRVNARVRLKHLERRRETCADTVRIMEMAKTFESEADGMLADRLVEHPAYPWFSQVKGCGKENVAKVVGEIEAFGRFYNPDDSDEAPQIPVFARGRPIEEYYAVKDKELELRSGIWVAAIERLATPSKLRKLAGHVGTLKRKKGEKIPYNQDLKILTWRLGGSLMKTEGKFYKFYLEYKQHLTDREEAKGTRIVPTPKERNCFPCGIVVAKQATKFCPQCGEKLSLKEEPPGVMYMGHLHNMAALRMRQAFLDALWAAWREAEGLPLCSPYPIEIQGHTRVLHHTDWLDR